VHPGSLDVITLPEPIARYFAADAAADASALAQCFLDDGVVTDEGGTFRGAAEIRLWNEGAKEKYRYTVEPVSVGDLDGTLVVVGKVAGAFPGSPVNLEHVFSVVEGKIASLEIR
jgi:ketosteroid isomerase-like protein